MRFSCDPASPARTHDRFVAHRLRGVESSGIYWQNLNGNGAVRSSGDHGPSRRDGPNRYPPGRANDRALNCHLPLAASRQLASQANALPWPLSGFLLSAACQFMRCRAPVASSRSVTLKSVQCVGSERSCDQKRLRLGSIFAGSVDLVRLSRAPTYLGARFRTESVPGGLPFSHDATSLAAAEVWNLVCPDGEFDISFHPSGFAGGYAELAVNAHHLRVGDVEVVVADLADVIRSKESAGHPKDLRVLPLLYKHLNGRRAERQSEQG
jgi:hypothetical protein